MVSDIIESIVNYTDYLRNNLQLVVSFCNISNIFEKYMHILYQFNFHSLAYCEMIKNNKQSFEKCIIKQRKVLEKSKDGAFYGICWAGIEEYVFPIKVDDKALGFISISGYRGKFNSAAERIKKTAKNFGFNHKELSKTFFESTKETIPNFNQIKTLIEPLAIMFERLYIENPVEQKIDTKEFSIYEKILDYLSRHYCENPTLEDIANHINYSISYVRQIFKKKSSHTIGEHITNLKMRKATWLLINSHFSVSKIASMSGFPDCNYFSAKFKKVYKMTPLEFRKINSTKIDDIHLLQVKKM